MEFNNQSNHLEAERQLDIINREMDAQLYVLREAEKSGDDELIKKELGKLGIHANRFEKAVRIAIECRDKLR